MTSADTGQIETEVTPSMLKSEIWKHFGFPMLTNDKADKVMNETKTIYKMTADLKKRPKDSIFFFSIFIKSNILVN